METNYLLGEGEGWKTPSEDPRGVQGGLCVRQWEWSGLRELSLAHVTLSPRPWRHRDVAQAAFKAWDVSPPQRTLSRHSRRGPCLCGGSQGLRG